MISPDILFLTETMVNEHNTERIISTIGFHNIEFIDNARFFLIFIDLLELECCVS